MNEYINKEYIRNIVQHHWDYTCGAECFAYGRVLDDIDEAPVTEIKHGRWIKHDMGIGYCPLYECSVCGKHWNIDMDYCGECGAKMDGVDNEI